MARTLPTAGWFILLAAYLNVCNVCKGQTNPIPVAIDSWSVETNGFPVLLQDVSLVPLNPGGTVLPQSPVASTNFLALMGEAGQGPPDTQGAVGTNLLLTTLNTPAGVQVQTRTGGSVLTETLPQFWTNANTAPVADVFDPKICFVPHDGRWIATAAVGDRSTNSGILIAVSQTSEPTNGWYFRRIKADENSASWADAPRFGFNKDWIVVAANLFSTNGETGLVGSRIFVFSKTNLYAGGTNPPTVFVNTDTNTAGSEMPAWTFDNSLSTLYLLQNANGNTNGTGCLRLWSITGSVGSEVLNNAVTNPCYVMVPETWADRAPSNSWYSFNRQKDSDQHIGTIVDAHFADVIYRNGFRRRSQFLNGARKFRV